MSNPNNGKYIDEKNIPIETLIGTFFRDWRHLADN